MKAPTIFADADEQNQSIRHKLKCSNRRNNISKIRNQFLLSVVHFFHLPVYHKLCFQMYLEIDSCEAFTENVSKNICFVKVIIWLQITVVSLK